MSSNYVSLPTAKAPTAPAATSLARLNPSHTPAGPNTPQPAPPPTPPVARFKPLVPGTLPASAPQPSNALDAAANLACTKSASKAPTVTVQRDGDRISRVRIECACGQVIDLDCVY